MFLLQWAPINDDDDTWSPHFQSTPRTTRVPILSVAANSGPETGSGVFGRRFWDVSMTAHSSVSSDVAATTLVVDDEDGPSAFDSTAVTQ